MIGAVLIASFALAACGSVAQAPVATATPVPTQTARVIEVTRVVEVEAEDSPETPEAPEVLPSPIPEPVGPDMCGVEATQLGPWAVNDQTEEFDVDALNGVVHASLWFPGKSPVDTEYSVVLSHVKIHVAGGGTAWSWPGCFDIAAANADVIAHGLRRTAAGKTTIVLNLEQLMKLYPGAIKVIEQ